MKRFSCIIFDLDGTIARTNTLIFETFNHIARKYLGRSWTWEEIVGTFGPPEEVSMGMIVGPARTDEALRDFYEFYEEHHSALAGVYDGVHDLLGGLRDRGIVLALFTGKGRRTTGITLEKTDLKNYFDHIITGSDVTKFKPSGEGILKIMKMTGIPAAEHLMVGDSTGDVGASREAGIPMAAALWDSYGMDEVARKEVEFRFTSIAELKDWLRALQPANGAERG